jgi:hypothetical protein
MSSEASNSISAPRIADRLAAARRGRFVGRAAELELFRAALLADIPPFVVLHVYGPGGIGKTTLLQEYARLALESGRLVVRLDGRHLDASSSAFLHMFFESLGQNAGAEPAPGIASDLVLLIDTYETIEALDGWLRGIFFPQLSARSLVVIAGRNPPAPAWRTDIEWADLTRIIALRNLRPEESQAFLAARGIASARQAAALTFTHGHPLALSLVADVLGQAEQLESFDPQSDPDVLRALLERFVHDVPSAIHRQALDVAVLAWATTEGLLNQLLGEAHGPTCFEWLRGLSFVEQGPYGLFPHDLVRDVLDADLRWRNPQGYRDLHTRLADDLHKRFGGSSGFEQQHLRLQIMYINRHHPGMKRFFDWEAIGSAYTEPATPEDAEAIVAMVQDHEGAESAQIARHWLRRQPAAFLIFRDLDARMFGFMAHLALHEATLEDSVADPALPAVLGFAERYGPIHAGQEIALLRFWMGRETYQAVSPALNLTAMTCTSYWLTHRQLAWGFLAMSSPDFMEPHFSSINIQRSPEADFEVGGRRYGIFAHDWRKEPSSIWRRNILRPGIPADPTAQPKPAMLVLSEPEFAEAARHALRDYLRPDLLAANPLVRSRIVREFVSTEPAPAKLQGLLRAAANALASPKDQKLRRALLHTYFEPAPTQERAAELLDLPFSTYRRHLTGGIQHVVAWLWQRELNGQGG